MPSKSEGPVCCQGGPKSGENHWALGFGDLLRWTYPKTRIPRCEMILGASLDLEPVFPCRMTLIKLFLLFLIASLDFVASPGVFNEFEGSYICLMCIYLYNLYMSQYFDFAWLFGMVKLVFGTFRNITWTLQAYSMLDFS